MASIREWKELREERERLIRASLTDIFPPPEGLGMNSPGSGDVLRPSRPPLLSVIAGLSSLSVHFLSTRRGGKRPLSLAIPSTPSLSITLSTFSLLLSSQTVLHQRHGESRITSLGRREETNRAKVNGQPKGQTRDCHPVSSSGTPLSPSVKKVTGVGGTMYDTRNSQSIREEVLPKRPTLPPVAEPLFQDTEAYQSEPIRCRRANQSTISTQHHD